MRMRPHNLIEIAAVIAVAVLVGIVAFRHVAERRGEELRMAVATMPLGITGAEADAIVGEPPDHVSQQSGVLVTPVTMLAATNSKAAAYGPPRYVASISVNNAMNSTLESRPSRRRPRFSLLTLLVLVTVIGIVLGLFTREWHGAVREKQVAGEVQRLGGRVRLGDPPEASGVISGWLHLFLGDEYFAQVSGVGWRLRSAEDLDLLRAFPKMTRLMLTGPAVTDAALGRLTGLAQLEQLSLKDAVVGEPGLKSLTCLSSLRALSFHNCSLSHDALDGGLQSLAELPNLRALVFSNCGLSDDNLKALYGARSLVNLSLREAGISDVGVAELQRALPSCKIRQ